MFGKGGSGGMCWGEAVVFSQSRLLKMSSCKTPLSEKLSDARGGKAVDSSSGILHHVLLSSKFLREHMRRMNPR